MRRTLPFAAAATPGPASVGEESDTADKQKHRRKRLPPRYQGHSRQSDNARTNCRRAPRPPGGPTITRPTLTRSWAGGNSAADRHETVRHQKHRYGPPTNRASIAGGAGLNFAGPCYLFSSPNCPSPALLQKSYESCNEGPLPGPTPTAADWSLVGGRTGALKKRGLIASSAHGCSARWKRVGTAGGYSRGLIGGPLGAQWGANGGFL